VAVALDTYARNWRRSPKNPQRNNPGYLGIKTVNDTSTIDHERANSTSGPETLTFIRQGASRAHGSQTLS
jgi:hypothetical protein